MCCLIELLMVACVLEQNERASVEHEQVETKLRKFHSINVPISFNFHENECSPSTTTTLLAKSCRNRKKESKEKGKKHSVNEPKQQRTLLKQP